jgi:surfactin synthase thioesterase subunit
MLRLIGFHHAGGSAAALAPLRKQLSPALDFRTIDLPGRGTRYREPLPNQRSRLIAQLCAELAPETREPYALFGHSLGGMIAYELAQALIASGRPAPSLLFVAATVAPSVWPAHERGPVLTDAALKAELQRRGGTPPDFFDYPDLVELFLPIVRADFLLCDERSPTYPRALPCPIHVSAGRSDELSLEQLADWQAASTHKVAVTWFEGDHFFPRTHAPQLAAALLERMREHAGLTY